MADVDVVVRDDRGRFVSGSEGLRKGSLNRLTKIMKEQLAAAMEEGGEKANPLVILLRIATDENNAALVRMHSADRLAKYLMPQLLSVEREVDPQTSERTARISFALSQMFLGGLPAGSPESSTAPRQLTDGDDDGD